MAFDWRVLLSALSSAAPQLAEAKASRRQQEALAQGELEAAAAQQRADKLLGDEVTKLSTSTPQPERMESKAGYVQALKRARAAPASGPNLGGERYQASLKNAAAATESYGRRTGDFYSQIDAPALQRQHEGQSFALASSRAADAGRQAETAQYLARLRAQRIRPNPWVKFLAGIGGQIANNYEPRGRRVDPASVYDADYVPSETTRGLA